MKKEKDSFFNKWNRLIKNMDIKECSITPSKEKFEEEFEDEIGSYNNGIHINKYSNFDKLLTKYLGLKRYRFGEIKVKILAKKGKIVIERIEE